MKRWITGIISVTGCLLALTVQAADTTIVLKDPRLDVLTQKQRVINQKLSMMAGNGLYKGFRIQVISTNKREAAMRIKAELLTNFPDHKSYTVYQSPNFKVRIGNFINRDEAAKLKVLLNKYYPQGVYIVEDAVEYNPREDELPVNE
jgi:hypothetical protein